jgi:hypothetical protein
MVNMANHTTQLEHSIWSRKPIITSLILVQKDEQFNNYVVQYNGWIISGKQAIKQVIAALEYESKEISLKAQSLYH